MPTHTPFAEPIPAEVYEKRKENKGFPVFPAPGMSSHLWESPDFRISGLRFLLTRSQEAIQIRSFKFTMRGYFFENTPSSADFTNWSGYETISEGLVKK